MTSNNPLFPTPDYDPPKDPGYILPRQDTKLEPLSGAAAGANAALHLIRDKLARIYADEPNAQAEERQAAAVRLRSKHQEFMYRLQTSGKSLAEIQTAWHNYYVALPDQEKHEVWREFYEANELLKRQRPAMPQPYEAPQPLAAPVHALSHAYVRARQRPASASITVSQAAPAPDSRTPSDIRNLILHKVTAGGQLGAKHHLQSLSFGLVIGFITLVITLFSFFNEVIIAPFIQPSRTVSATPIIVDPNAITATSTPEVIIPKINLEIPADYAETSNAESAIQNGLERGIVHYPSTVLPGQNGNAAFFGHSSNNIFNPGQYKFAFVLLHELVPGDTFYLTYGGKAYVYKVFKRVVVEPTEVDVLNNVPGHTATATLITCDPPGTALHRLVVVGDQISPDPVTNGAGANTTNTAAVGVTLPDNGPTLWDRIIHGLFGT